MSEHEIYFSCLRCGKSNCKDFLKGFKLRGRKLGQRILRDNAFGITKFDIRRLARKGGIKRMSINIYDEIRGCLKAFLERLIHDAIRYAENRNRYAMTLTSMDVIYALKSQGRTLYGYEFDK